MAKKPSIEEIFGPDYRQILRSLRFPRPSSNSPIIKDGRTSSKNTRSEKIERLYKAEADLLPFKNHQTNEILQHLIPIYKSNGFTQEYSINRILAHIENSPHYTESLNDPVVAAKRVIAFYPDREDTRTPHIVNTIIFSKEMEELITSHPFVKQRTKGIRKYFTCLISWKISHDRSLYDKPFLYEMIDMYPYYAINRKKGFYPLPSILQEKWNKNYNTLLPWLKEIGILKESPFPYSSTLHICKYYEIHIPELL